MNLAIPALRAAYAAGTLSPTRLVDALLRRIETRGDDGVWITLVEATVLRAEARALEARAAADGIARLPLYGIPFAVKDNIDVAELPTTAGCPDFSYQPQRTAPVIERLRAAGALLLGKTNLDQFATGLVGTRSPYGVSLNPFDRDFIPGGSSSGSAVAVAAGLASFALGTDTAGSGRVPAGFTNIVGLKPTRGLLPTTGVVPACLSLDCVSVFALTVGDAVAVAEIGSGADAADPYSREKPPGFTLRLAAPPARFRFGVPRPEQRQFFGDAAAERLFGEAIGRLETLGGEPVEIDYAPFAAAAELLYGPFVVERTTALDRFLAEHPQSIHPVTREILAAGRSVDGVALTRAFYRLEELRAATRRIWRDIALMLLPTAPTIYRVSELEADPIQLNARLGTYANFVNLLDLSALAVPNGFRPDGLPSGVTLIAPAWHDGLLAAIGDRFHRAAMTTLGATGVPFPPDDDAPIAASRYPTIPLAVVGAHLSGMALNGELVALGAALRESTRTAPQYRLYALADGKRPGLVRVAAGGAAIEVEVWEISAAALGPFTAGIAPPLAIGAVTLADGSAVPGFVCQGYGIEDARDITELGGWRRYQQLLGSGLAPTVASAGS